MKFKTLHSLEVRLEVGLRKRANLHFPCARTPAMPSTTGNTLVTMGVDPDLMVACRDAVREMIDELVSEYKLTLELAYCLCSVAGGLRIGEVVDAPNWVVAMHVPSDIFSQGLHPRWCGEALCHTLAPKSGWSIE